MKIRLSNLSFDTGESRIGIMGVEQEPPVIRDIGVELRRNLQNATRYIHREYRMGVGWNRADRGTGRGTQGLRDSTWETRYRIAEHAILHESQSHASPANHIRRFVGPFKGDFFCFFEEDYANNAITDVVCRVFGGTSDNWTGGGTIESAGANAQGMRCYDAVIHGSRMYAFVTNDGDDDGVSSLVIARSSDGVTWEEMGTVTQRTFSGPAQAIHRRNNFDDFGGRLLSSGGLLISAEFNSASGGIRVRSTPDPEADSPVMTTATSVPAEVGPKALVDWYGLNSNGVWVASPVLIVSEGVFSLDIAGQSNALVYRLDGDPSTGLWADVGDDGDLYIGMGNGDLVALHVPENGSGPIQRRKVGPPGDGFVAARQGHVNFVLGRTGLDQLFVAYGGHAAGQTASIWAIDFEKQRDPSTGKLFQAWHHMYVEADENVDITQLALSSEDDQTPRLHFVLEGGQEEMFHLERPDVSGAASGISIKRQSSAYMELAEEDFDDPHGETTVLRVRAEADGLDTVATIEAGNGTNTNHIEVEYGINGGAWTAVSDFAFLGSDDLQAEFGRLNQNINGQEESGDPEGIAARTLRLRITGYRDATETNGPQLKEVEVQGVNQVDDLIRAIIPIDLDATSEGQQRTPEQVHDEVLTIIRSDILVPFEYGRQSVIYVKCRMIHAAELESDVVSSQFSIEEIRGKMILVAEEKMR